MYILEINVLSYSWLEERKFPNPPHTPSSGISMWPWRWRFSSIVLCGMYYTIRTDEYLVLPKCPKWTPVQAHWCYNMICMYVLQVMCFCKMSKNFLVFPCCCHSRFCISVRDRMPSYKFMFHLFSSPTLWFSICYEFILTVRLQVQTSPALKLQLYSISQS